MSAFVCLLVCLFVFVVDLFVILVIPAGTPPGALSPAGTPPGGLVLRTGAVANANVVCCLFVLFVIREIVGAIAF